MIVCVLFSLPLDDVAHEQERVSDERHMSIGENIDQKKYGAIEMLIRMVTITK